MDEYFSKNESGLNDKRKTLKKISTYFNTVV